MTRTCLFPCPAVGALEKIRRMLNLDPATPPEEVAVVLELEIRRLRYIAKEDA